MTQESTARIRRQNRTAEEQTADSTRESLSIARGWKPPNPCRHSPLRQLQGGRGSHRGNRNRTIPPHVRLHRSLRKRQGTSSAADIGEPELIISARPSATAGGSRASADITIKDYKPLSEPPKQSEALAQPRTMRTYHPYHISIYP